MTQPDLTIRANFSPFSALNSLVFLQAAPSGYHLPVLQGEDSDVNTFRIYNNFARNSGIASALNVIITTFDGAGAASHTAMKSVVGEQWIKMNQIGFGESVGPSTPFTYWDAQQLAIGGSGNVYTPEKSSNGVAGNQIRAGGNNNSAGFLEFKSHAEVPSYAQAGTFTFALVVIYDWIP
jgi:hypothetical protein